MVDYESSLNDIFADWKKVGIGMVLSMLPVVRWLAKGYFFEAARTKRMPAWDDWLGLFVKGFAGTVISFLYAIPALFVLVVFVGTPFMVLVDDLVRDSLEVVVRDPSVSVADAIQPVIVSAWPTLLPKLLGLMPWLFLAALLWLLGFYFTPAAVLHYLERNDIDASLEFGHIADKALRWDYCLVWLATSIATAIGFIALAWIPLVGWPLAFFLTGCFTYLLIGQVYSEGRVIRRHRH